MRNVAGQVRSTTSIIQDSCNTWFAFQVGSCPLALEPSKFLNFSGLFSINRLNPRLHIKTPNSDSLQKFFGPRFQYDPMLICMEAKACHIIQHPTPAWLFE